MVLPDHNLETSIMTFDYVDELWCSRKSIRSPIHGSRCQNLDHVRTHQPTIFFQQDDGTVLQLPKVYVTHLKAPALATILENKPGQDLLKPVSELCEGTSNNRCFGILLFLTEHFLTGEAKTKAEETLNKIAGFSARRAYQEGDREEAIEIVSRFPIKKILLDSLMELATSKNDMQFAAVVMEAKNREIEGEYEKRKFSL